LLEIDRIEKARVAIFCQHLVTRTIVRDR
jgi:hypothetical protein